MKVGKNTGLLYMLASLVLLAVMVAVMMTVPGLRGIGQGVAEQATSRLENLDSATMDVTSSPFTLPDYMWDIKLSDHTRADLRPLISSVATVIPDVLDETGLRIYAGESGRACALTIEWDTDEPETLLNVTLYDRLERPLEYSRNAIGCLTAVVPGGLYKVAVSSNGKLGKNFILNANTEPTSETPDFSNPGPEGIPTINIKMADAIYQSWDTQRAKLYKEIVDNKEWVDTSDFKKVLADITFEGVSRTTQLWAAGSGDPTHFSAATPSFSGKIISGPLLFGISNFKLYSIRTQEGLMNDIVQSIIYDEGIFVPRWVLVNATLNNNGLGLYLLVETPNSDGFFSGVLRYPGLVDDWQGDDVADPLPAAGLEEQEPLSAADIYSPGFSSKINQTAYAKTLALISRFEATHGLSEGDLRWYRNPYLDTPEPVLRDLNAGTSPIDQIGQKSVLIHTGWWMGPRLVGAGPHFNPKVFPSDGPIDRFAWYPTSLTVGTVHNSAYHFVRNDANREVFERYLFYVCDEAIQRRFSARIESAFIAAIPYLDTTGERPLPKDSQSYMYEAEYEIDWLGRQVEENTSRMSCVAQDTPLLLERSALLVSAYQESDSETGIRTVSLYNLSPFSARIKLPDYANITANTTAGLMGKNDNGWYLSPSLLFPTVMSVATDNSQGRTDPASLNREEVQRFLTLERICFRIQEDGTQPSAPFIDVKIPADRYDNFISILSTESVVTLGGTHRLPPEKNLLVNHLSSQKSGVKDVIPVDVSSVNPKVVILPLRMEQINPTVTRLSLLITNYSKELISLNLRTLRWIDADNPEIEMPSSLHAIWKLGDVPVLAGSSLVDLGPAGTIPGVSDAELDSPMLWTGGLKGFLAGAANPAMPNAVLAEYDFPIQDIPNNWIQTDGNALAQSAVSLLDKVTVVIHEPFRVYLPKQSSKALMVPGYQSPRASTKISISSHFKEHIKDNLVDGNADTIWHVNFPPETTKHWVSFDFGNPINIEGIAVLPHKKLVNQMWDQDHAVLQGSNDPTGYGWVDLARLFVDKPFLLAQEWDWISFSVPNTTAYRYYRIYIDDPTFLSIAEVKFKIKEWQHPVPLTVMELLAQGVMEQEISPDGLKTLHFKDKNAVLSSVIEIPAGYILEIYPGTTITCTKDAGILSYSPIKAMGTAAEPVTFKPLNPGGEWLGVAVLKALDTSVFEHVIMTGATGGSMGSVQFTGGLTFMKTSISLNEVEIDDFTSEDGLHLSNSFYEIKNLKIGNSYSDGLDSDWSNGTITSSVFLNNGGDGVDLSGSRVTISNCTMEGNADKGISVGEGSVVYAKGVYLIKNRVGVAVKDQSAVKIIDSEITRNHYGLLRYIKKPVFIFPELVLENNVIRNNITDIYEEKPEVWTSQFN